MYDVLVIGGGPAGMTAAIYTCRKKLKTLIVSIDFGGQTNLTNHIENYPGVDPMPGWELMSKFEKQAMGFGAEIVNGKVSKVEKKGENFMVSLASGERYSARSIVLAFGKVPRKLGMKGEDRFMGRGVHTCVTCDAPLYSGKKVAVIGGGNSAVEGALELSQIGASKVYLIHRRDEFRADEVTVERAKRDERIELKLSKIPIEVKGDKFVSSLVIEDLKNKEKEELELDGVFIEIGYMVDTSIVKELVELNESREIIVDDRCATSHPGIFAAGDVTTIPFKQTIISAGDGAKAGLECHRYLSGGKGTSIDWA